MKILNPDDNDVEIISLVKTSEYDSALYRIRVKINGKYYVGHLEKSE